ncbi:hypothetical protein ACFE04_027670 [Oxalis oulophora]
MRSRFLSTDYFAATATTTTAAVAVANGFFNFQVPQLPRHSSNLSILNEDDLNLLRFNFGSIIDISLEIERLPIDSALSKFLSHVIPQNIDVGDLSSLDHEEVRFSQNGDTVPFEDKDAENRRVIGSTQPKNYNTASGNGHTSISELVQFEAPEVDDIFLENVPFSKREDLHIFSEFQEIENDLGMTKPEFMLQCPSVVPESVYSVGGFTSGDCIQRNTYILEDDVSVSDQTEILHHITFPLLEVDEMSVETSTSFCMENLFLSLLEDAEPQNRTEKDNMLMTGKELLGSMKNDLLEFLSDHCLAKKGLISDIVLPDIFPELDIVSMVGLQVIENSENHQGTADGDHFCAGNLVSFQELQFLDEDPSLFLENLFNLQTVSEPETCQGMFTEDMNFKNFDELVVSHELALVDDTFKSLPIPVISDSEKLKMPSRTVEEILVKLKPQSLSSVNGIYLDWHVLDENKHNGKFYSFCLDILGEIKPHGIDFDKEYLHGRQLLFEFVFSDISLDERNIEEKEETLTSHSNGISMLNGQLMGVPSTKFTHPKPENGEQTAKKVKKSPKGPSDCTSKLNSKVFRAASSDLFDAGRPKLGNEEIFFGKASPLYKSMSQFDDLELVLNSRKASANVKTESTSKAFDTMAIFPNVSHELSGRSTSTDIKSQEEEISSIFEMGEDLNNENLKRPLNVKPIMEKSATTHLKAAEEVQATRVPLSVPCAPCVVGSEGYQQDKITFSNTVIIVNTLSSDKEMVVSRRSTYQKILAIEKKGAQVAERDSEFPVDVILSSAVCLVWYDSRNIARKTTSSDEASSNLPLCIENIAANILTSLSFAFSGCILVFEGDFSFLSTVMESSDGLYAAAASLGIDLQLFCSYSSELTDEIILSCIGCALVVTNRQHPIMPESESLAESFLTKFPSINPLTAHAILSSGGQLIEFLEWSNERRIHAVQKYVIPRESISLFSALCRYGEREDSKSIMTDCSSSVSSDPDSGKGHSNVDSQRKRPRENDGSQEIDIKMDDLFRFEAHNQFSDGMLGSVSNPKGAWMSKEPAIYDAFERANSPSKDLFTQEQEGGITRSMNFHGVQDSNEFWIPEYPQTMHDIKTARSDTSNKCLGRVQESEIAKINNLKRHDANVCKNPQEKFRGETIDLTLLSDDDFPSAPMDKDCTKKPNTMRRLSFGMNIHPTFPTVAEINSDSGDWESVKYKRQNIQRTNDYTNTDYDYDKLPPKDTKNLLEEILERRHKKNSEELPYQEETSQYGGTPLSNALHSVDPQSGSPWTIEFLNRVRERSRTRLQSLPCDNSSPGIGKPGNISKFKKRRSPSILEFFKYQGGKTPAKVPEQKNLKRPMHTLSCPPAAGKTTTSYPSTWTPQDKKARKTLSFAMTGGSRQTKLVWNDESDHGTNKKFRNS